MLAVLVLASPAYATAETRPAAPAGSPAAANPDEQARDLSRGGRFAEALQVYQRLRAETHHPTYLRNIGRCHQMMRQPGPAIDAFEAYLRDVPTLDAAERTEVQGYIVEMRALQARTPPSPGATPPPPSLAPRDTVALDVTAPAVGPTNHDESPPPDRGDGGGRPSILHRWWFWAGVGAVVVTAGIVAAVAASGGTNRLPCPSGAVCP